MNYFLWQFWRIWKIIEPRFVFWNRVSFNVNELKFFSWVFVFCLNCLNATWEIWSDLKGSQQQDAHEFFIRVLERLCNECQTHDRLLQKWFLTLFFLTHEHNFKSTNLNIHERILDWEFCIIRVLSSFLKQNHGSFFAFFESFIRFWKPTKQILKQET